MIRGRAGTVRAVTAAHRVSERDDRVRLGAGDVPATRGTGVSSLELRGDRLGLDAPETPRAVRPGAGGVFVRDGFLDVLEGQDARGRGRRGASPLAPVARPRHDVVGRAETRFLLRCLAPRDVCLAGKKDVLVLDASEVFKVGILRRLGGERRGDGAVAPEGHVQLVPPARRAPPEREVPRVPDAETREHRALLERRQRRQKRGLRLRRQIQKIHLGFGFGLVFVARGERVFFAPRILRRRRVSRRRLRDEPGKQHGRGFHARLPDVERLQKRRRLRARERAVAASLLQRLASLARGQTTRPDVA